MAERPGIMFYFSLLDDLEDFTTEEIGELFLAMMRYGSTGEIAEFEDRGMRSVWRNMMRYVDRDQDSFDNKILQRQFAGWTSAMKKKGWPSSELPSFEKWKEGLPDSTVVNDRQRPSTTVDDRTTKTNEINQLSIINNQSSIISNQSSVINSQSKEVKVEGSPAGPATLGIQKRSEQEYEKMREAALAKLERRGA